MRKVPDDVVRLRAGDAVPADVRVVSGECGVDMSTINGEVSARDNSGIRG